MDLEEKNLGQINPAFISTENEENSKNNEKIETDFNEMEKGSSPSTLKIVYDPKENRRMLFNVFLISIAFTFLITAFQSIARLQSSINNQKGLGTYSLSVIYVSVVISSMFMPTYLIRKFTVKWTLVFAAAGYSVYIAAQFEPRFETLIPAATILGLCAAPLWSAKCTYLTHIGHQYSQLTEAPNADAIIVRFFGIFFLFFQSSSIWGNLISSAVLSQDSRECENDISSICGVYFGPGTEFCDANSNKTGTIKASTRYTLSSIYLACSLAAVVILALFLDPLIRYGEKERQKICSKLAGKELFIATFKHMRNPYQILMIPLSIWSGMEQGFFGAEYTAGYVNCAWGIEKIGLVLICYGIVDAFCSVIFGPLIKYTGRLTVFICGAAVNISTIIFLLNWTPDPNKPIMFFVVAGLWGAADAIWLTQINAFYGVIFPQDEEPAFSNYRLWESLGFIATFVLSNFVCIKIKLCILLCVIILGMVGYLAIEFMEGRKLRK